MSIVKEILFQKEISFYKDDAMPMDLKQRKIIESLELLHPNYQIKRKKSSITDTPIWEITVFK